MTTPKLPILRQLLGDDVAAAILKPGRKPRPPRKRPVPRMKRHVWGAAYVAYKDRGRRVATYFGRFGSEAAARKYNRWAARWPAQLSEPLPTGKFPKVRKLTFRGRTMTLARWAAAVELKATTLRHRLDVQKWSVEKALTTPRLDPVPPQCRGTPVNSRKPPPAPVFVAPT